MKRITLPTILALTMGFVLTSCEEKPEITDPETEGIISLNISGLMELDASEQYEGWIIVDNTPVSTGTFTVNSKDELSKSTFKTDSKQLNAATDFVLSIEPKPDMNSAPSSIKILGGVFSGSSATITAAHGAALGNDFSKVAGKYILATPTTTTKEDELSGVWFLDLSGGAPSAGLTLPALPEGWIYEGWAVINGKPVTTGTFSSVDKADNKAPYSGKDADGPMFPGEDFVSNAPDGQQFPTKLSGSTMLISIEPNPDNSPAPFVYKPLVGMVPEMADDHKTYEMKSNVAGSFPTGTVKR